MCCSTGFEFRNQSFDFLAASPLPTLTSAISVMPTVHQKHAASARWVVKNDVFISMFLLVGLECL